MKKCAICEKEEIWQSECSNAMAIILEPNRLMLSGNIKTTMFQTLFTEVNFCPFCGRKLINDAI